MALAVGMDINYRSVSMLLDDDEIGARLARKDESTFEQVFKSYFKNLHAYAFTIIKDEAEAEEIVQQVFFKIWERADRFSLQGPLAAYLYRAVHNESLNYIKHQKVKAGYRLHVVHTMKDQSDEAPGKRNKELEHKLSEALHELPEQCRTIFQLSRFEDLKYREIAEKLNISVKTVENQMCKALRIMRLKLAEFLTLLILLLTL